MKRQLPKRHDLAPLLKFKKPTLSPKERRLAAALTIEDLRRIAKRRTPKPAFDYTDGAADGEVSLARARRGVRRRASSTRRSCATSRRSTPRGRCSASGWRCRSGSRRPASPG